MSPAEPAIFSGEIPANYDHYLGPMLFEPFAVDMVGRLSHDHLKNVLELACGTGRLTRHVAAMIPDEGSLVATDLNAEMIKVAKSKVYSEKVVWQVADAQQLPFKDEVFDHVVCQFGVMFFEDKLKAFREVYRVLQRKGRFIFNTWDSLDRNLHSHVVQRVLKEVMQDEAPDFMETGPFSMYKEAEITRLVEEAGFSHVQIEPVHKKAFYENDEQIIRGFLYGSPLASFLNKLEEPVRERIREKVGQEVVSTFGKDRHEFAMEALVCMAWK